MAEKRNTTARVQVYDLLKNDISSGFYPAGYRLREQELSDRYHISRSPIREALRQLTSEGLLTEVPNHGVTVKRMSTKEMTEIYDARLMLENYAIYNLSPDLMTERLEELQALLRISEQAYRDHDLNLFTILDKQMHTVIISMCSNAIISEFYEKIRVRSNQFRTYALSAPGRWEQTMEEHRTIVNAIAKGDFKTAKKANTVHMERAKESVLKYLEAHGN